MFNIVVNGEVVGNGTSLESAGNIFNGNKNIVSVDMNNISFNNNSMSNLYRDCQSLLSISNINENVTK